MIAKEHQERIAKKIQNGNGQILYWDLGSGKTFGAINASNSLNANTTVITPASLQENFNKELEVSKSDKNRFIITSYDKFIRDPKVVNNDLLIVDEAHKLRNSNTARSKILNSHSKAFKKRLLLTGTPIQDKPSDLASLVNVVSGERRLPTDPKVFNDMFVSKHTEYPNAYERLIEGKRPTQIVKLKNLPLLRKNLRGMIDYHSDKNPADYPTVIEASVPVEMTKEQVYAYNYFERDLPKSVKRKMHNFSEMSADEARKLNAFLSATRQVSNTNARFGDSQITPKIKKVITSVINTDGPSLIYSNYLDSGVSPISNEFTKLDIPHGVFTGQLDKKQKRDLVDQYNSGKLKALIVSSSGGEGLDLKNTRAVHILEPHWNNPKIDQVVGRAIRYKSHSGLPVENRKVNVYKYLSTFPEEKNILTDLGIASKKTNRITADEYLYNISSTKDKVNKLFLKVLKEEGSRVD